MATKLRPTRKLNAYEHAQVNAVTTLVTLTLGQIEAQDEAVHRKAVQTILGSGLSAAVERVVNSRGHDQANNPVLGRVGYVEIYDEAVRQLRRSQALHYLYGLRDDPITLARFISTATGARAVTVGTEEITMDPPTRKRRWLPSRSAWVSDVCFVLWFITVLVLVLR